MRKNCLSIAGFEDKGRSQKPKDIHSLQKLEKARKGFFLISFRRNIALLTLMFSPIRFILDSSSELWDNKFVLFQATKFVKIWYSHKLLIPLRKSILPKSDKDSYHMISLICRIWKKKWHKFTKQKYSHRCRKQTHGYREGNEGRIKWQIGIDTYILLYIKQITNKNQP